MAINNSNIAVLHGSISSGSPTGSFLYGPAATPVAITTIILCNNTPSTDITVSIYAVASGSTPYAKPETTIVSKLTIPAGETVSFDQEKFVLAAGDSIQATASVAWSAGLGVGATVSTLPV
jgi:hypothetical protein